MEFGRKDMSNVSNMISTTMVCSCMFSRFQPNCERQIFLKEAEPLQRG